MVQVTVEGGFVRQGVPLSPTLRCCAGDLISSQRAAAPGRIRGMRNKKKWPILVALAKMADRSQNVFMCWLCNAVGILPSFLLKIEKKKFQYFVQIVNAWKPSINIFLDGSILFCK